MTSLNVGTHEFSSLDEFIQMTDQDPRIMDIVFNPKDLSNAKVAFGEALDDTLKLSCHEQFSLQVLLQLDKLIGGVADRQYYVISINKDEPKFFEDLLDVAYEKRIHELITKCIKQKIDCRQLDNDRYIRKLNPDVVNDVRMCLSILAHIASGSKIHTDAIHELGVVAIAEKLALQEYYLEISCQSLKILECYMSENRNYAKQITNTIDYLKRSCELYMCVDDDDCQKAWLLYFIDWAYRTTDMGLHMRDHYIVTCLNFSCNALDTDDRFLRERTVNFLLTVLDEDTIHKRLLNDGSVVNLIAAIVRKLVIMMADNSNRVCSDVVFVLGYVFDISWRPHHRSTLLHIALPSGLMSHIVYWLHSDDAEVLEPVLWLLSIILRSERLAFELESTHSFIPLVCFHLHSQLYLVASQALMALHAILYFDDSIDDDTDLKSVEMYITNHPEVLTSILAALRNVIDLKESAPITEIPDDEDPMSILLDHGLRCLEYVVNFASYDFEKDEGITGDKTAKLRAMQFKVTRICNTPSMFETLRYLKRLNVEHYDVQQLNFQNRLTDIIANFNTALTREKIDHDESYYDADGS